MFNIVYFVVEINEEQWITMKNNEDLLDKIRIKATSADASQTDKMRWKLLQLIKFADASRTDKIPEN